MSFSYTSVWLTCARIRRNWLTVGTSSASVSNVCKALFGQNKQINRCVDKYLNAWTANGRTLLLDECPEQIIGHHCCTQFSRLRLPSRRKIVYSKFRRNYICRFYGPKQRAITIIYLAVEVEFENTRIELDWASCWRAMRYFQLMIANCG